MKSCVLPVCLIGLMGCNQAPKLELLKEKTLSYPSSSAIEYYQDRLYVVGDDATYVMVTDADLNPVDSIVLFPGIQRLPKYAKPDLESMVLVPNKEGAMVEILSSASLANRNKIINIQIPERNVVIDTFDYFKFRSLTPAVMQPNIEGSALVNKIWVQASRAHDAQRQNSFIVWHTGFLQSKAHLIKLQLPLRQTAGVSSLYFDTKKDVLYLTLSEEATSSVTEDGAIGGSYLGAIRNFSSKLSSATLAPDYLISLSDVHRSLRSQKIEGITLVEEKRRTTIFLCADNDDGKSTVFKLALTH